MLTIAGGVILGVIGLGILGAILSNEAGCAVVMGLVALLVIGALLLFAYSIWGNIVWQILGALVLFSFAESILDWLVTKKNEQKSK